MDIRKQKVNFQSNILSVIAELNDEIEEALEPLQDGDILLNLTSDGENHIITFAGRQILSSDDSADVAWYDNPSQGEIKTYLTKQMRKVIGDLCVIADKITEL